MKKTSDKKGETEKVKEVIPELKDEFKEKYLRALADYQNVLKRTAREKEDFIEFAAEGLIRKLLSVLDNLERAKGVLTDKGIDIIYNELWKVLVAEGVERMMIQSTDTFDPMTMECINVEEGGKQLQEVRAGYTLKGKALRAAQVKVVK